MQRYADDLVPLALFEMPQNLGSGDVATLHPFYPNTFQAGNPGASGMFPLNESNQF